MGKHEKLRQRFLIATGPFDWQDLVTLLKGLGFEQLEGSGSRVCFSNGIVNLRLHKPHPGNEVKTYAVKQVREALRSEGLL